MISGLHFREGRMCQLPLSNLAVCPQAVGCKKGNAVVRELACKIW